MLHPLDIRDDFVDGEFLGGLRDQVMLFGEVFRGENVVRLARFDQETAARNLCRRYLSQRGHILSPQNVFVRFVPSMNDGLRRTLQEAPSAHLCLQMRP